MNPVSALKLFYALVLFVGICGIATSGCVTAQQQRQADIGPQTYPRALPETTPSADRVGSFTPPARNRGRVDPTPTISPVPPAVNQNTYGL